MAKTIEDYDKEIETICSKAVDYNKTVTVDECTASAEIDTYLFTWSIRLHFTNPDDYCILDKNGVWETSIFDGDNALSEMEIASSVNRRLLTHCADLEPKRILLEYKLRKLRRGRNQLAFLRRLE